MAGNNAGRKLAQAAAWLDTLARKALAIESETDAAATATGVDADFVDKLVQTALREQEDDIEDAEWTVGRDQVVVFFETRGGGFGGWAWDVDQLDEAANALGIRR